MYEKFMKGLIEAMGNIRARKVRDLSVFHNALASSIHGLDLSDLLPDIQCTAAVRYG